MRCLTATTIFLSCVAQVCLHITITNHTCPNINHWRQLPKCIPQKSVIMLGPGSFHMGSSPPEAIPGDGETPLRLENIGKAFWIDSTEVTVGRFRRFARVTGYKSVAEHFGNSFMFWMSDMTSAEELIRSHKVQNKHGPWWWISKPGVSWRSKSSLHEKHLATNSLPVTHVSWDDAVAFCNFAGGRLPTEEEWEYACRGGLEKATYPWGSNFKPNGSHMANIWQADFPIRNSRKDGYVLRAPVASFPCNSFGLYDVVGNVWEWVDGEWSAKSPTGHFSSSVRVQKGGSFLCHRKHCFRYRCSARTKASRDSTSSNVGFRCAYDV